MDVTAERLSVAVGELPLLAPVSFQVPSGGVLAVRGANGTGKTTLLRVVSGLLAPTGGRVSVGGAPVDERAPAFRRAVAALIGLPPLARNLTLREHLVLVAATWGAEDEAGADRLLARLGLARFARRFPHELSSGQTQLFALALTLARPSSVLVLDEPEQRLDPDRLALLAELVRERADAGTTVILATHNASLDGEVADRRLLLTEPERAGDG